MQQIVKRLDTYTQEDYKMYCSQEHIVYKPNQIQWWAICEQENDLWDFINSQGRNQKVTVNGFIDIDIGSYPIKPKTTSLENAFTKMLTPDIYDFEVFYNQDADKYYVNCYHAPDYINLFEFTI